MTEKPNLQTTEIGTQVLNSCFTFWRSYYTGHVCVCYLGYETQPEQTHHRPLPHTSSTKLKSLRQNFYQRKYDRRAKLANHRKRYTSIKLLFNFQEKILQPGMSQSAMLGVKIPQQTNTSLPTPPYKIKQTFPRTQIYLYI